MTATLYIFSGLPASGKSTLAQRLSKEIQAAYFRIDTIEQGVYDLCKFKVTSEGYRLSYRIIADNLKLGVSCIADSCNPIRLTRKEWRDVATGAGVRFVDIEVVCSDAEEHQRRVQSRRGDLKGMSIPTWDQVLERAYDPWDEKRIVVDTAGISIAKAFDGLQSELSRQSDFS